MSRLSDGLTSLSSKAFNPAHYAELRERSFWQGCVYLFSLLLVLGFLQSFVYSGVLYRNIPTVQRAVVAFREELPGLFPDDLIMDFKNGELSVNKPGTQLIEIPERWKQALPGKQESWPIKHLLAIDTEASPTDFKKYESIALMTREVAAMPENTDGIKLMPYANVQVFNSGLQLDKAKWLDYLREIDPYIDQALPFYKAGILVFVFLWPFIGGALTLISYLIYLLVTSLLLFLIAKASFGSFKYEEIYCLSFYGLTLPLLISALLGFVGLGSVPFIFSLIFGAFMLLVLSRLSGRLPNARKSENLG